MLTTMVRRSLAGNRRVTLWTFATLTACAALVVIFTTIALDVGAGMSHTLRRIGANAVAYTGERFTASGGETSWHPLATMVRSSGGTMLILTLRAGVLHGEPVGVVSTDGAALARMTPYWNVAGRRAIGPGECMVGRKTADHFELSSGANLRLEFADGSGDTVRVAGIFESGDEDEERIFVTVAAGSATAIPYALLSVPGGESRISRVAGDPGVLGAGIVVKPLRQIVRGEENVLAKVTLLCALALGVVVMITSLGVTASVWSRVIERRKEFALIQTLGATSRDVISLLLAEATTLGGVAAVTGFIVGTLAARGIVNEVFGVNAGPRPTAFLAGFAASLLVSTAATLVGAWRTQRILPTTALRNE